ncbi:MAG: hypothetical protein J6R38_05645 [Alistipes sp.]|nr:hypothetical protein [Alistipes sp.]
MKNRSIAAMLSHLTTLTRGWDSTSRIPAIERDIALEELRTLYETIMDLGESKPHNITAQKTEEEPQSEAPHIADETESRNEEHSTTAVVDSFDDILDIDALLGLNTESEPIEPAKEETTVAEVVEPENTATPHSEEVATEAETKTTEVVEVAATAEAEPEVAQAVHTHKIETPEPNEKSVIEPTAKPRVEPGSAPSAISESLFGIEDIPVRSKSSRRMISLYNTPITREHPEPAVTTTPSTNRDEQRNATPAYEPKPSTIEELEAVLGSSKEESTPAPQPAPAAVEEVAPQPVVTATINNTPTTRLGDVLGSRVTVLGDKLAAEEQPTTPFNRISDLRKAIGINDKFLMVRDLFDGNNERYESTIETLNEFDDLDECMIYIVENFAWNPDSEGAKLLISLLERKLS